MSKEMLGKVVKNVGMGVLAGLVISKGADMIANAMVKKMEQRENNVRKEKETVEEKLERVEQELNNYKKKSVKRNVSDIIAIFAALEVMICLLLKEIGKAKDVGLLNAMMIHDVAYRNDLIDEDAVIGIYKTAVKNASNQCVKDIALEALASVEEVL